MHSKFVTCIEPRTLHGGSGYLPAPRDEMAVALAASFQLQPPAPFNFNQPEEWPRWKSRFEQFRLASGLLTTEDEQQVSTLLYCLGEQAEEVLRSANTSTDDRSKHDDQTRLFLQSTKERHL